MKPENFLSYLEKVVQLKFSLLLLAAILFFDCYFLIFYKINLLSINYTWLRENFDFGNIILLFLFFSLSFSFLIKMISMIVQIIVIYIKYNLLNRIPIINKLVEEPTLRLQDEKSIGNDLIHKDILRTFAINTNNLPAYKEYMIHLSHIKELRHIKYLCKLILLFSFLGYLISNPQNPSVLKFVEMKLNLLPWYIKFPSKIVFLLCIIIAVFYAFDKETEKFEDYIYLPGVNLDNMKNNS